MAIDPVPSNNVSQNDSTAPVSLKGNGAPVTGEKKNRDVNSAISELETIIHSMGEEQREIESLCERTQSNLAKTKAILDSL